MMVPTGSILLGIALLLVVLLVVARPFFMEHFRRQGALSERQALEAQKEALVAQIRELDFDHETGKMPDDVYKQVRADLMVRAAALLQQIDRLQGAGGGSNGAPGEVDREIEEAVRRLRRVPVPEGEPGPVPPTLATPRHRSGNGQPSQPSSAEADGAPAERFCPHCGKPREKADRYCAYCGQRLE